MHPVSGMTVRSIMSDATSYLLDMRDRVEAGCSGAIDVELVVGDLTEQVVDAVVNAANSSLLGGGGVDGAIHRKGGPAILAECRALRAGHYGRGLRTGQAVFTTAGKLPARWVIHTVGPVWSPTEDRSQQLRDCYRNALTVAAELGARSVAFPLISSGIYRWPKPDAIRQALTTIQTHPAQIGQVRLVLFDAETLHHRRPGPPRAAPPDVRAAPGQRQLRTTRPSFLLQDHRQGGAQRSPAGTNGRTVVGTGCVVVSLAILRWRWSCGRQLRDGCGDVVGTRPVGAALERRAPGGRC